MTLKSTVLDHICKLEEQGIVLKYEPTTPLDSPEDENRCIYITPIAARLLTGETVERCWETDYLSLPKPERFVCNASLRMFITGESCWIVDHNQPSDNDPDWKLLRTIELIVWEIRFRGANAASANIRVFGFFLAKDVFLICAIRHKENLRNNISYVPIIQNIENLVIELQLDKAVLRGKSYSPNNLEDFYDVCLSIWEKANV